MGRFLKLAVVSALALSAVVLLVSPSAMEASGNGAVAASEDFLPVWSPDGRYIAFMREAGDYSDSVYIVAVKSGQQRRLVAGGHPTWSPDGTHIAFDDFGVFTIKLDRTGRKRVATDGMFPLWSPDGRNILFERIGPGDTDDSWLYVVPAAGGKTQRVAKPGSNGDWSPDGTKIAFDTGDLFLGSIPKIRVVGRDGKGLRSLSPGTGPKWSPKGSEIAFTGGGEDAWTVSVMRSDGSNVRALRSGEGPVFSPDGKRIAYYDGDSGSIWVMNRDGSNPRRLTRPAAGFSDFSQVWSPDGRTLAFVREKGVSGARIWLVNSDGTHARQLTH